MLSQQIRTQINKPFWIDTVGASNVIEIRVQLKDAQMRVYASRNQAYATYSSIFIGWMAGTALVLIGVAVLFLRNQIKPIRRLAEASEAFGSQCIVVAVDAKQTLPGRYEVFTHGGRNATGLEVVAWTERMADYGAGEILLTSMDRDGTREGFDLPLTRRVADTLTIPVIASGGVGNLDHLVDGIREGHASAVLAASIFHYGEATIAEAKARLIAAGIPTRPYASA